MSRSAFTVKVFGIYALVLGVALILVPNVLLGIFDMPQTSEVWVRVVGVVVFNIGVAYWYAAKCEAKAFFRSTVFTRIFVLVAFVAFWQFGFVSPVLILFGVIDVLGAAWTYMTLKSEERA